MFFKVPRVAKREFQYQPRYFDAREEALKEKIRQRSKQEAGENTPLDKDEVDSQELRRSRISDQFSSYRSASRYSKGSSYLSGFQRIALIAAFFIGLYWLANQYLQPLLNYLTKEQRKHDATLLQDIDEADLPDDFTPTRAPEQ